MESSNEGESTDEYKRAMENKTTIAIEKVVESALDKLVN